MRKFFSRTIIICLPFAVLLIGDLLIGFLYEYVSPEWGKRHLEMLLSPSEKSITQTTINPYLAYSNTPHFTYQGIKQHNANGYRNSYDTFKKKSGDEYRILCVGGSTTYGQGVAAPINAWPEILHNKLNENKPKKLSGKKIVVMNGGLCWGSSAELLTHYLFKHLNYKIDLVIVHTGGNDTGPLSLNNFSMDYSHWRNIEASGTSTLRPFEKGLIEHSNSLKLFYSIWFNQFGYQSQNLAISTKMWNQSPIKEISRNLRTNPVSAYENNLNNLFTVIKKSKAIPIFFQFYGPSYDRLKEFNRTAYSKTINLLGDNLPLIGDALAKGKQRLRKVAKDICDSNKIEFWEIESNEIPERLFVDQCHLNREGQAFKARFAYTKIIEFLDL